MNRDDFLTTGFYCKKCDRYFYQEFCDCEKSPPSTKEEKKLALEKSIEQMQKLKTTGVH